MTRRALLALALLLTAGCAAGGTTHHHAEDDVVVCVQHSDGSRARAPMWAMDHQKGDTRCS